MAASSSTAALHRYLATPSTSAPDLYAVVTMGTALASLVGVHDLIDSAQIAANTVNRSGFTVLVYFSVLALFFAYCYPIARLTQRLERRYAF